MEPRKLRTFSLFESQRKRGGRSKFRDFLASLGHVMRPYLNRLATVGASALTDKVTQAMGKTVGKNAIAVGSSIIGQLAKEKTEKLLDNIKGRGGGAFTGLPDDISERLSAENKKSLVSIVGKKKRKKVKATTKRKVKRKIGGKKKKKASKNKKNTKRKKAGSKSKSKKGGRKTVTKTKPKKSYKSIFD